MKPLTELDLRMALKDKEVHGHFTVPEGTLVTPSAAEYLRQRKIELVYGPKNSPVVAGAAVNAPPQQHQQHYDRPAPRWDFSDPRAKNNPETGEKTKELFFGPDGGTFDHKPEAYTHLKGRQLVHKDHPIIIWRGKLDTLTARIVEAQLYGQQAGNQKFIDDMEEILGFVRRLLTYEIRGKEVEDFHLLGLDAAALRERSHDPVKFFGHRHMLTTYKMGPLCVALNTCRAITRETELAAAAAFKDINGQPTRDDLIRALNRLSSLFYIMMFMYLPPNFEPEWSGI